MGTRGPLLLLVLGLCLLVAGSTDLLNYPRTSHAVRLAIPLVAGVACLLTAGYWHRSIQVAVASSLAAAEREAQLRRIAHERLVEREQWNRSLFENNPMVMLLVDPDTDRIADANPAACRFYGRSRQEMTRMAITDVHALPAEQIKEMMRAALRGTCGQNTFTHRLADNTVRTVSVTTGPLWIGGKTMLFSIVQDVTEHAQQQEQLKLAKQEAEQANAAKDRFLAGLSHELRTPLTPVILSLRTILSNAVLPQSVREDLVEMQHQVELEACLISDLLDVTSLVRGEFRIHPTRCDLHVIIRRAMNLCRTDALARSQRVELRLAASSHMVSGDPARLQQVFWNLIRNAIKFTPEDGTIVIATRNSQEDGGFGDGEIVCDITDSGIGMDSQTMSRVFNAFEKVSCACTSRYAGLGLGLAIAQAIVEKHGGRITATSPGPNAGSRFTVGLKAEQSLTDHGIAIRAPEQHKLRVLLIEDDPGTLRSLTRLLRLWGYEVTGANCAAAALSASTRAHFDLIVSDVGLPDGTGPAILPELRRSNDVPAIAISGFGMEQDIRTSLNAGFSDHLIKPINPDTLQHVIHRLLCPVSA